MRFPVDFGNADADRRFFQLDHDRAKYAANKARLRRLGAGAGRRHAVVQRGPAHADAHARVLSWIEHTLAAEWPDHEASADANDEYDAWLRGLQEDAAVLHRDGRGRDEAIMVSVHAPSGWRPERIVGASFTEIHRPVPDFSDEPRAASSMVTAMIERGPYVRFVWTVTADDELDHHPDHGRRRAWPDAEEGFLRVERQITVPFADVSASLFLIRTYVYPLAELTPAQHQTLETAVEAMPDEVAAYKGLLDGRERIVELIRAAG